jgi:hypothetical protein
VNLYQGSVISVINTLPTGQTIQISQADDQNQNIVSSTGHFRVIAGVGPNQLTIPATTQGCGTIIINYSVGHAGDTVTINSAQPPKQIASCGVTPPPSPTPTPTPAKQTGTLNIKVYDATSSTTISNRMALNAQVTIYQPNGPVIGPLLTAADGTVPAQKLTAPGTYPIHVVASSMDSDILGCKTPTDTSATLTPNGITVQNINLVCTNLPMPAASITGNFIVNTTAPHLVALNNLQVRVYNSLSQSVPGMPTTYDTNGDFTIPGLPDGTYTVTAFGQDISNMYPGLKCSPSLQTASVKNGSPVNLKNINLNCTH